MSAKSASPAAEGSKAASKSGTPAADASGADTKTQVAKLVAEGRKALALKQWEDAVTKYGDALELQRTIITDELDASMAPLLLAYGRSLFELALSQQGVMGREEVEKNTNPAAAEGGPSNDKFVFEGDGDDDEGDEGEEGQEGEEGEEGEGEDGGDEGGDDGVEDDMNAAWDVLDVARTIYKRETEGMAAGEGREERLSLSDCYGLLGDVSLENENFDQAAQDYAAALEIKQALLPASSRLLASARYQLGTVLELTPAGRSGALKHVQAALDGFRARAAELKAAADGQKTTADGTEIQADITRMTQREREAEVRDVAALIGDLEAKLEELNAAPPANDFVAESINHLLGGIAAPATGSGSATPAGQASTKDTPVNDLTSMVRKKAPKKKPAPAASNGAPAAAAETPKRKADEQAGSAEKKTKTA